jgi:hypothetical protein
MLRTILRLAPAALSVVALAALSASPVRAANSVTTLPATQVATRSANFYGLIDTSGLATTWQFQYGTSTHYDHATPAQVIPPGQGQEYVAAYVTQLHPNTTYHFRVAAFSGTGADYYFEPLQYGADRSFTTKSTGRLLLLTHKLLASRGSVAVPLACRSGLPCAGTLSIDTQPTQAKHHPIAGVVCATAFYRIRPDTSRRLHTKVHRGCLSLLRAAANHRRRVQFRSTPSTGQLGVTRTLSLRLG